MLNPFEKINALRQELDGASDRAAAIVAGAILDEVLQELLREFLVKDSKSDRKIFEGTGPLSTFSAKIEMAFRLGLLSKWEHQSIHTVRKIRNKFAHVLGCVSFDTQSVKVQCKNIEVPISMVAPDIFPLSQSGEIPPLPTIIKADANKPRAIFQETVITLLYVLEARVIEAVSARRSIPGEFSEAHEPPERMLLRLKDLLGRYDELSQHHGLTSIDKDKSAKDVEKYRLIVRLCEFVVNQIKRAHASEIQYT